MTVMRVVKRIEDVIDVALSHYNDEEDQIWIKLEGEC